MHGQSVDVELCLAPVPQHLHLPRGAAGSGARRGPSSPSPPKPPELETSGGESGDGDAGPSQE